MERRTKLEIINKVLSSIAVTKSLGIAKTRLLQSSNLSPPGFKEYYTKLISLELIREVKEGKNRKKVFLTDAGIKYLKKSNLILKNINKLKKDFDFDFKDIRYK